MRQADPEHPRRDRVQVLKWLSKPLRDYVLSAFVLPMAEKAARHEAAVML
jgi:hypothetical protein